MNSLLSVIIISHNQRDKLRRCINSVLAQCTTFPVEVIVSDDRSIDGTLDMLKKEYNDKVIISSCNSDECNPNYTLERAGYNRLNGLKNATGKYLIHVDGDDYFLGNDSFERMIQTLEAHPECNLCCQNFRWVVEGHDPMSVRPFVHSQLFEKEQILTPDEYVTQIGFIHNSAICVRRGGSANLTRLSGNTYDDADITFRYMGGGKIALINRANFVYVQYEQSICSGMSDIEKLFIFPNGLTSIQLNPHVAGVLLKNNIGAVTAIAKRVIFRVPLQDRLISYFKNFDMFIYSQLGRKDLFAWLRYCAMYFIGMMIKKAHLSCTPMYRLLFRLTVRWKIDSIVKF